MSRRIYLIALLISALSVGAGAAQSASAQKEKVKEKEAKEKEAKEKSKQKEKVESRAFAATAPEAFAFQMGGGERSYLGVFLEEVTADRMKELNLSEERGAVVMKVSEGSPAQKAGMKENDVIISFNGRRVDTVREVQRLLSETPPGRTVTFDVLRGGAQQTLTATVTKRTPEVGFFGRGANLNGEYFKLNQDKLRAELEAARRNQRLTEQQRKELEEKYRKGFENFGNFNFVYPGAAGRFRGTRIGITAEPLTGQLAEYFGVKGGRGVLVTEVQNDRPAAKAGLKAGDVITAIDGKPIENVSGLVTVITEKEGPVVLTIIRNQAEQSVTVNIEKRETRPAVRRRANL
ncbi:MAG TPA: PDZ domain-containing protein [Blastocatellia bacterium]|nr:PDZ domain-containing protein [Blastocatellia bacterium]